MVSLEDIRREAELHLSEVATGNPLDEATCALIAFAVRISVTSLDVEDSAKFAAKAFAAGVTADQLHEAVILVSGVGVHSLFEGTRLITRLAGGDNAVVLDKDRQQIWDATVGKDKYWDGLEREVPGFLKNLLQVSKSGFDAFFRYCAVPWKSGHLSVLSKELIAMAADATPTHRYLPGMRLHLINAIRQGAGREAITQALKIAAAAPGHSGVR